MEEILTKILHEALPFIGTASIGFFVLILLIRIIAKIVFFIIPLFFIKKYKAYKTLKFQKKQDKPKPLFEPNDNIEFRKDLEKEQFLSQEYELMNVARMNQPDLGGINPNQTGRSNIVGLAKPVGKWTSLFLGEKLSMLVQQANVLSEDPDKGFWVSMLEARERTPDFHRGRSM